MDPTKKNWLIRLQENIKIQLIGNTKLFQLLNDQEQSATSFVQSYIHSTGLIYGYTIEHIFCKFNEDKEWSLSDHVKIAVTEAFYTSYLKHSKSDIHSIDNAFNSCSEQLIDFYKVYYPKLHNKSFLHLSKPKTNEELIESILNERIASSSIIHKKFWKGASFNIFFYIDIFYFAQWLEFKSIEHLPKLQFIKTIILEILIAAIWSNKKMSKANKILFDYFLSSANISPEIKLIIEENAHEGLSLNDIEIPDLPFFFKTIILKNAIISLYNDKEINEDENTFLYALVNKLQLDETLLDESLVQAEAFILQYHEKVPYFNNNHSYDIIKKGFSVSFSSVIKKNKSNIIKEIYECKELVELLWKSKDESLTPEEKEKVKAQITDLLRTLPSLAIFMLPGGSLILPIILKILPDDLVIPSSFRN